MGIHGNEFLKKLFLRLEVETDEEGFGLAFGLMIINKEPYRLSVLPCSLGAERLSNNGREKNLIAYAIRQNNDSVFLFFE
jgi:hypothetical protein